MRWTALVGLIGTAAFLSGCGGTSAPAPAEPARAPAPMRVVLGQCGAEDALFRASPPSDRYNREAYRDGLWRNMGQLGGLIGNEVGDGGSGFGSGAGGGSGAGAGVGTGSATQNSDSLDADIIRRYIRRKLPRIKVCYEKRLLELPDLAGKVVVEFVIDSNGVVSKSEASGLDPQVDACVAEAIRSIRFPKPQSGGTVNVRYPFHFRASKDEKDGPPAQEPGARESAPPKEPAAQTGLLGALGRPSWPSSLIGAEQEIEACAQKHLDREKPWAVLALDLRISDDRKLSAATATADPLTSCLYDAARTVAVAEDDLFAGTRRCPLALGTMPIDALGTIDIDASVEVTALTARVAELASKNAQPSQSAPVSLSGPYLVRIGNGASASAVLAAVEALDSAGLPYLLATRRQGRWHPLHDPGELPQLPDSPVTGLPSLFAEPFVVELHPTAVHLLHGEDRTVVERSDGWPEQLTAELVSNKDGNEGVASMSAGHPVYVAVAPGQAATDLVAVLDAVTAAEIGDWILAGAVVSPASAK